MVNADTCAGAQVELNSGEMISFYCLSSVVLVKCQCYLGET